MKKIIQFLTILMLTFLGINSVKAKEDLGIYGIYCEYDNGQHFRIQSYTMELSSELVDNNGDFPVYFKNFFNSTGYPSEPFNSEKEVSWLKNNGFLVDSGTDYGLAWSCPNEISSEIDGKIETIKLVTKKFLGSNWFNDVTSTSESYTCNYSSKNGKLTIKYRDVDGLTELDVEYPDGTKKTLKNDDLHTNYSFPTKNCEDVYYIPETRRIVVSVYANDGILSPSLKSLCSSYQDSEIEHFCSGECKTKEISCSSFKSKYKSCGSSEKIPAALPILVHNVISLVKILIPILLIILGMLDFGKAVVSNDEKTMNESKSKFIKRVIGAVAIFLVVAVTQFIFKVINLNSSNDIISCIDCFINNNCHLIYTTETTNDNADNNVDTNASDSGSGGGHDF